MGISSSVLTEKDLNDYQQLTYFTEQEILQAFRVFQSLGKQELEKHRLDARISNSKIMDIPELRANPFRDRICSVFSSNNDDHMSFEDFLHMMSVFSEKAPKDLKAHYAFNIYDFDNDERISEGDLSQVLDRLTIGMTGEESLSAENKLEENDKKTIIREIMKLADLDEDNELSFSEFCHIIDKSPEFMRSFVIHL